MEEQQKQSLIDAIKNPPPERLAKIEYQSHALQAIGISFVCIMLFMKGFWYVIFALIFGVGISYSQGMSAYMKHKAILEIIGKVETIEDYEKDISWTRRRSKIINSVFGSLAKWLAIVISIGLTFLSVSPGLNRVVLSIIYLVLILTFFFAIYFNLMYWISYPIYKSRIQKKKVLEGGKEIDAKEKETTG